MHKKVFYFSTDPDSRREIYSWVENNKYDITADFQLIGQNFNCRSSKDLLLFLDNNIEKAKTLFVIIDFEDFYLKEGREKAAKDIRHAILGYPEVFFLFYDNYDNKDDAFDESSLKKFLFPKLSENEKYKTILESMLLEYHIFDNSSQSELYFNGERQKNPFEALYHKRSNLFDGSNLRYLLKSEEYARLEVSKQNFKRIQEARASSLVICVEEERTQNRFNSYAAYANGYRTLPIESAEELKWFNKSNYISKVSFILRDYDLQFYDAHEEDQTLKPADCSTGENLVDYIRGAKNLNNLNDNEQGNWTILEDNDNNHFWNNLKDKCRIFVSKGVRHMDVITKLSRYQDNRKDEEADLGKFEQNRKDWQYVRGFIKPVSGIYSSFQKIDLIKVQYENNVSWKWNRSDKRDKKDDYLIRTQRASMDGHGAPLDIYELTKSMVDRAKRYYNDGKYVIAAVVSWEAIEILNGFHQSLMLKAYHIHAISENAICMNILGGKEKWLREDTVLRIEKIKADVARILAADKDGLQVNILNQIFSDCRNFCREKEHFDSESEFLGAMARLNEGGFLTKLFEI